MTKVMSDILRLGNFQISNQDVNIQSRQRQIREKSWSRPKIQRLFKNYIAIQAFIRLFSGHGPQTGRCVLNDKPQRYGSAFVCQIQSWWVHYVSTIHSMIHPKVNPTLHLQVPSGRWPTCVGEDEAFDNWLRNPHSVHQGKDAWAD